MIFITILTLITLLLSTNDCTSVINDNNVKPDSGLINVSQCRETAIDLDYFNCTIGKCANFFVFKKCPENKVSTAFLNLATGTVDCRNSGAPGATDGLVSRSKCKTKLLQDNNTILRCEYNGCDFGFHMCENPSNFELLNFNTGKMICLPDNVETSTKPTEKSGVTLSACSVLQRNYFSFMGVAALLSSFLIQ